MATREGLVVGVDASRNRSGGAKAHLRGILSESDPTAHGIRQVHVWGYQDLLRDIPDAPWLEKHSPAALDRTLLHQIAWQYRSMPHEARRCGCDIMFITDAGTVRNYERSVVMSQDMLSYEPGEIERYGVSAARARLILLRYLQNRAMRNADGVIFLTDYAARVIQQTTGTLGRFKVIPLGVGAEFRRSRPNANAGDSRAIRCLYLSNALMYKHQWHVIAAVGALRLRGYNVTLKLAGGGSGRAQQLVDEARARWDPSGQFVEDVGFVRHAEVPALIADADMFVFASSCENMPVTLIEGMAGGLPIACSNRGPMPEILEDAGEYFNPQDPDSIARAIERIVLSPQLSRDRTQKAAALAQQFSWARCANETWAYLSEVASAPPLK